jgi:hypothetical protein
MRKWVLWGHHLTEYREMFGLPQDLSNLKILEFASGPTAVNHELTIQKVDIVSCDPWFEINQEEMHNKFQKHFNEQVMRVMQHPERFDFDKYGGMEFFIAKRQEGMQAFFQDFVDGFAHGRYRTLQEGKLPFVSASFDLALCSNYFFADLPEQNLGFHLYWIQELTRVAREVRFYPLTDQEGRMSDILGQVLIALQQDNYQVAIENVPFRLVPASQAVLKVSAGCCHLD